MMAVVSSSHLPGLARQAGQAGSAGAVWPGLPAGSPAGVLDLLALRPRQVACPKDVPLGNATRLVELGGGRLVLRRYYAGAPGRPWLRAHGAAAPGRHRGQPIAVLHVAGKVARQLVSSLAAAHAPAGPC